MPLDGHSYLVSQGWGGKGTALREGAISRPIAVTQKKNLAGLGKDRDEAFPFWDHLFSAAAKSIVVKCLSDDEDSSIEASSSNEVVLKRTSTGILSTRRPIEGTPATSGTVTPDESTSRLSLMANAKRDAARRNLYSRFFKGPVIGPETIAIEEKRLAALVSEAFDKQKSALESVTVSEHIETKTAQDISTVDIEASVCKKEKKVKSTKSSGSDSEDEAAKRERKSRRREEKKRKREEEAEEIEKQKSKKSKQKRDDKHDDKDAGPSLDVKTAMGDSDDDKESKAERKRRREEKKRLKALKTSEDSSAPIDIEPVLEKAKKPHSTKSSKSKKGKKSSMAEDTILDSENLEENKKKKKRKRADDDEE